MAIDVVALKAEREKLKEHLRELEQKQRKLEAELKVIRQGEIQTKRQVEALSTLIELREAREPSSG